MYDVWYVWRLVTLAFLGAGYKYSYQKCVSKLYCGVCEAVSRSGYCVTNFDMHCWLYYDSWLHNQIPRVNHACITVKYGSYHIGSIVRWTHQITGLRNLSGALNFHQFITLCPLSVHQCITLCHVVVLQMMTRHLQQFYSLQRISQLGSIERQFNVCETFIQSHLVHCLMFLNSSANDTSL